MPLTIEILLPSIPDFTTINKRINKLNIQINDNSNKGKVSKDYYLIISIYSNDIKVTNREHLIRAKWNAKNKKEYLKIHIVAVVSAKKKKILSVMMKVTDEDEHVHDDSNKALP